MKRAVASSSSSSTHPVGPALIFFGGEYSLVWHLCSVSLILLGNHTGEVLDFTTFFVIIIGVFIVFYRLSLMRRFLMMFASPFVVVYFNGNNGD